ncbi:sodium/potassium-transporting ATPase subunit beta-1-like [Anopheles bellator]|uniref:sodium/potassium-transporting ATPase subunit beta-1-like n=1 Tax=Anopheles bellator TaxID=139047 RepID=UPI002647F7AB|nr:sodium/potassium-transporting ATPase subunit beta-1-like [Anopheles bellator]
MSTNMSERKRSSQPRIIKTYEFPTMPEKQSLGQFLYDTKSGRVMGRTAKSWGQLLLFYTIFYIVLAALYAICMQGLLVTLNHQYPRWQLDESRIGTNPGVTFRPRAGGMEGTSEIQYVAANKTDVSVWVDLINEFLEPYTDRTKLPPGTNQVICDFVTNPPRKGVCAFDVSKLGPCTAEAGFGYNRSAPCFFVKLNKIYNWEPDYYDNVEDLPADMPDDLVEYIKSLKEVERKQIWISCSEDTKSEEKLLGPIEYFPSRGLPAYYYPYLNLEGYLSPLVAVQLARPQPKSIINIECRAWAKNIIYNGGTRNRLGSFVVTMRID